MAFPPPHVFVLALLLGMVALRASEPIPIHPHWGTEPVEAGGGARGTICLNGVWAFHPGGREEAGAGWGEMRVPGAWSVQRTTMPGCVRLGAGVAWNGLTTDPRSAAWQQVKRGVYARRLAIPADWAGRRIVLDLRRVGTDARVFVDGKAAGAVASPAGAVDLTEAVTAGADHLLEVDVAVITSQEEVMVFMGPAAGQNFKRKQEVDCRGLIGDVLLTSSPRGPHCRDLAVRTSVRQGRIDLDLELADVVDGPVRAVARMRAPGGTVERTFEAVVPVAGGRATMGWSWSEARRWDVGRPELYRLDLELSGAGWSDRLGQEFGFRELWIDGRRLMLNGSEFHPRTFAFSNDDDKRWGMREAIDAAIDGLRTVGFDCHELWPWDRSEPGAPSWHDLWYERAMRKGWGVIAPVPGISGILGAKWSDPAARAAWERSVQEEVRRHRNNPAILMWIHTPNVYCIWNDMDPRLIGRRLLLEAESSRQGRDLDPGREACEVIRRCDPTRPVTTHSGGAVGDVQTINLYPCLTQPQEQAEWITDWVRHGDLPFWPVEWGPYCFDYRRGRYMGWGDVAMTPAHPTEHLAAWQGNAAYAGETRQVRLTNPQGFDAKTGRYRQIWDNWMRGHGSSSQHAADQMTEVFRSWRTLGASFPPLPWESECRWEHRINQRGEDITKATVAMPAFDPGRRGTWFPALPLSTMSCQRPEGSHDSPSSQAIVRWNGATMAWICARPVADDPGAITAKDHLLAGGSTLEKAVALVNDSRRDLEAEVAWRVEVDGKPVAEGRDRVALATGTVRILPVGAALPVIDRPAAGVVACRVSWAGGRTEEDAFPFTVLPSEPALAVQAEIADPIGASARLLVALGVRATPGAAVRVVGRNALAKGGVSLAGYEDWVRGGGRLLIMAQDPAWLRATVGWRVGRQVLRRVFPVDPGHPLFAGLGPDGLRDWSGAGSLVEARPRVDSDAYGWRWGNRGSVCSAPIEKPHRSGWRPLLECDYDLASTPLMELDVGRGRVTWCQLDLEERGAADPAVRRLAANLLRHVAAAQLPGHAGSARFLGDEAERGFLVQLGLELGERGPVVVGRGADPRVVAALVEAGEPVVALAPSALRLVGRSEAKWPGFAGEIPAWTQLAGLSRSDLRRVCDGVQALVAAGDGVELAGGGLFARHAGSPSALACLVDPRAIPADELPYLRQSRWRATRALCQVLANAGAGFAADRRLWSGTATADESVVVPLAGGWKARMTLRLPAARDVGEKHRDQGPSTAAQMAVAAEVDDASWETLTLPGTWGSWGGAWAASDGEGVFRRRFQVSPGLLRRSQIFAELGPIDDVDTVWINGVEIGHTGADVVSHWQVLRRYPIPPGVLKIGDNVIAIRAADLFADGRVGDDPRQFRIIAAEARRDDWYHPDFDSSRATGDDPHRYTRW